MFAASSRTANRIPRGCKAPTNRMADRSIRAAGIDVRVHIAAVMVVLKAAEAVLPRAAGDGEIEVRKQVRLPSVLVGIRRQRRIAVEPPFVRDAAPTVRVTQAKAQLRALVHSVSEIEAFEPIGVGVVLALAVGVELVAK